MANLSTLSDIRTLAKQYADMENMSLVSDSEWLMAINLAYAELYDILVSKFEDYYTDSYSYTIPQGGNTIPLPSNFYKLRRVDYYLNGEWITLKKYNFSEANSKNQRVRRIGSNYCSLEYRLVKDSITVLPETSASGDYKLWYIPSFTRLEEDSDTVDGVNGWEQYIAIHAAIYALTKEETPTPSLDYQLAKLKERIEQMSDNRDAGEPERVVDISKGWDWW